MLCTFFSTGFLKHPIRGWFTSTWTRNSTFSYGFKSFIWYLWYYKCYEISSLKFANDRNILLFLPLLHQEKALVIIFSFFLMSSSTFSLQNFLKEVVHICDKESFDWLRNFSPHIGETFLCQVEGLFLPALVCTLNNKKNLPFYQFFVSSLTMHNLENNLFRKRHHMKAC